MKKIIIGLLVVVMLVVLTGCDAESQSNLNFHATILEINDTWVLAETIEGKGFDYETRITFLTSGLEDIGATVGDIVDVVHTGTVLYTYPEEIYHPINWSIVERTVQFPSIPIGVFDREIPKTVGVYIADGESSAMVILQENNDFALQGSEYISLIPSGKYRIDNGKLFLSMGDYDIIFLMEEYRLVFESGTWLEYLVEIGTVFHLTDKYS